MDMSRAFIFQTKLTEIPADIFDGLTEVVVFSNTFGDCTGLTNIPEGLFDKCTKVTSFNTCFAGCTGITSIPEGLFDKCTKVTDFSYTFAGCTGLTGDSPYTTINVDGNDVKVHLYERSSYPEHFTAPEYFNGCFNRCTGLIDIAESGAAGWN